MSLSDCAQFPELHPHVIAKAKDGNWYCGEFAAVKNPNACAIQFSAEPVEWFPLEHCNGYYGFPGKDLVALQAYQA